MPGLAWLNQRKKAVLSVQNPHDISTIVNIFPQDITEYKWTIQPSKFEIPKGNYNAPSFTKITSAAWFIDTHPHDDAMPLVEVPIHSTVLANSVVRDWASGLHKCDMENSVPGVFWIAGDINLERLNKEHRLQLEDANKKQRNWYHELVKDADILWTRTNGNPLSISSLAILAANELGIKGKPWLSNIAAMEMVACIACGNMRNPNFPICNHCKMVVDQKKAEALGLKFVA